MMNTIADQYLTQNAGRRYPMADDSSGIPDSAVVDFRCTVTPPSGWTGSVGRAESRMARIDVTDSGSYRFTVSVLAFGDDMRFQVDVPANAERNFVARYDTVATGDRQSCRVLGSLTVGEAEALEGSGDVGADIMVPMSPNTTCVDLAKVMSVTAESPTGLSDTLTGDIRLVDGYNTVPVLAGNAVTLSVGRGAGIGADCGTRSSSTCDGVMLMLNSAMAGSDGNVTIEAGPGVTVTAIPEKHVIEISTDSIASGVIESDCR